MSVLWLRTSSSSVCKVNESIHRVDKLNIRLIIFLDNILIIGATKEVLQHKETVVYLLQNLIITSYKHQEISCSTNPRNRIFGDNSIEKVIHQCQVFGPNQNTWCSVTSKDAISLSSESTNTLLENKSLFFMQSSFKPSLSNKSDKLQWSKSSSGKSYLIDTSKKGWGVAYQGKIQ